MSSLARCVGAALLLLVLGAGSARAVDPNIPAQVQAIATGNCIGTVCPGVPVSNSHPLPITIITGALPTGAATSANQTTEINNLVTISNTASAIFGQMPDLNGDGGALAHITNFPATQAISAVALPLPLGAATETTLAAVNSKLGSALPLPTGAATSANQSTEITSLGTLITNTTGIATAANQTTANGSLSTIATAQGAQGTGSTFNPPAGGSGILGYLSGIYKAVTGTVAISAASLPLPNGAAQDSTVATGNASAATTATNTGNTATNTSTTATNTGAISTATGTTADSAWSGSGASTVIAALKAIYGKLAATLTVTTAQVTPAAPDISTVTTGGTAVNAFSAGHCSKGCIVVNPKGATVDLCANGITTASGTVTFGALICIPPGQQFGFTPRSTAISVVSSDSAHPFGGEGYQ